MDTERGREGWRTIKIEVTKRDRDKEEDRRGRGRGGKEQRIEEPNSYP